MKKKYNNKQIIQFQLVIFIEGNVKSKQRMKKCFDR